MSNITKTVELRIKTVDLTGNSVQTTTNNLKKIEVSAEGVGKSFSNSVGYSTKLNNNISQMNRSYDVLNQKAKSYESTLRGSAEIQSKLMGVMGSLGSGNISGSRDLLDLIASFAVIGLGTRSGNSDARANSSSSIGTVASNSSSDKASSSSSIIGSVASSIIGSKIATPPSNGHIIAGRIGTGAAFAPILSGGRAKDTTIGPILTSDMADALAAAARSAALKASANNVTTGSSAIDFITKARSQGFTKEEINAAVSASPSLSKLLKNPIKTNTILLGSGLGGLQNLPAIAREAKNKVSDDLFGDKRVDLFSEVVPKSVKAKKDKKFIDSSLVGQIKLAAAAAITFKSLEIGIKGANAFLKSYSDNVDEAAKAYVGLGESIKSIPLIGGLLSDLRPLEFIFDFSKVLENEKKITDQYNERLELAKDINKLLTASNRRSELASMTTQGQALSSSRDNVMTNIEEVKAKINERQLSIDSSNSSLPKLFKDWADWGGQQAIGNLNIKIKKEKLTAKDLGMSDEMFKEMTTTRHVNIKEGKISTGLQKFLMGQVEGHEVPRQDYAAAIQNIATETININSLKEIQVNYEKELLKLTEEYNKETKETLKTAIEKNEKSLKANSQQIALLKESNPLEQSKLQLLQEEEMKIESINEMYNEQLKFIKDRNIALKEAGLEVQDLSKEEEAIKEAQAKQIQQAKELTAIRRNILLIAERERKEAERLVLIREANNSKRSAKENIASFILSDRASRGDKEAKKILDEFTYENSRTSTQSGIRTAINNNLGLSTFSGANEAIELSKLFGLTTDPYRPVENKEFNEIRLPDLKARGLTTGVREQYLETVGGMKKTAELQELNKQTSEIKKTNAFLRNLGLNAITLEEK